MSFKRLLPLPGLSVLLLAVWLLLISDGSLLQWLPGLVLALALPALTRAFMPDLARVRRLDRFIVFLARLSRDIVVANGVLAVRILGPRARLRPAFVVLPLDLDSDFAIAVLTSAISLTPGTLTADISPDRRQVLIHALGVSDPEALVVEIKQRYEAPLKEVFAC